MVMLIPVVAIAGGFTVVIVKILSNARVRELELRQRIAMIEKGLVPAPETDPRGFEQAMAMQQRQDLLRTNPPKSAIRHRRFGITLMGIGFGLMLIIGVAGGSPEGGIGVGGSIVVLGIAFFVNSLFDLRHAAADPGVRGDAVPPK
jgi:hypothetical protein